MPSEQGFHCILSTGLISCWIGTDKDERLLFFPVAMYQASYQLHAGPRKWMNIISPSGVLIFASLGEVYAKRMCLWERKHWNIKWIKLKKMLRILHIGSVWCYIMVFFFFFHSISHLLNSFSKRWHSTLFISVFVLDDSQ